MKKRLFAGALALLMIIGLLPVSSMLKKPVEAQAAGTTNSYVMSGKTSSSVQVGDNIADSINGSTGGFFSVTAKLNKGTFTVDGKSDNYMKLDKNSENAISFTVKGYARVTVKWGSSSSTSQNGIAIKDTRDSAAEFVAQNNGKNLTTSTYDITEGGTYEISNVSPSKGGMSVYVVEVTVAVPTYTINVKDGEKEPVSTVLEDGEEFTLNTTGDNFLYWETSSGKIISRTNEKKLNAYYDETYTAVYGSDITVYYMTEYGHVYKRIAAKDFNEAAVPDVPIRYGYNVTGWKKDVNAINTDISEGIKAIYVDPDYSEDTTTKYKITVDKIAVGGSKAEPVEKAINSVYTVSTDSSEFKCWKDADTDEVLSYNSTYSFFVNKDINIVAEAGTAKPAGIISLVLKDNGKADNKDSVVVFEYTVPAGSTVTFAGVYASPDQNKLTKDTASYVDGGSFSSNRTYKYTITKRKGMATWYVKAVLEYTDSEGNPQKTIYYGPVEF